MRHLPITNTKHLPLQDVSESQLCTWPFGRLEATNGRQCHRLHHVLFLHHVVFRILFLIFPMHLRFRLINWSFCRIQRSQTHGLPEHELSTKRNSCPVPSSHITLLVSDEKQPIRTVIGSYSVWLRKPWYLQALLQFFPPRPGQHLQHLRVPHLRRPSANAHCRRVGQG